MFEDIYMPEFDMDYFNSPAFQQAIAAGVEQYSPAPVAPAPVYTPPPVYTPARGIGRGREYNYYEPDAYYGMPEDVYNPVPDQSAVEADLAAAQAEADRIAAEEEYFARVEAERLAVARAQALEAEAERTQSEAIAARAEQARIAAEQAATERVAAEQVAAQAQVVEQQAVQTQAVVQAEVQRVAEVQAAEDVYTPAPAAEPLRGIGRRGEYEGDVYAAQVPETYAPAPTPAPAPVYTPPPEPAPAPAPEPTPVYNAAPEPVRGIGRRDGEGYYEPAVLAEDIYTPAAEVATIQAEPARTVSAEPTTVEAEPVAGIGSSAISAPSAQNYTSDLNLSDADLAALSALSSSDNFNQGNYGSDFGSLDNVYGMNFGSDMGSGGSGGSLYKVNPYLQSFAAPLSDKGNSTAYGGGSIEVKSPTQKFRLVDKNTDQVVYEGVGYEGAQEAINRANALTAEGGAKAQWQIQTPNSQQESGYSVVANEKRSQSTLGDIASFALPIAMAVLTGGMSLPAQMAGAAIAGAAGAALAGKDPAKAGIISAATAGLGNVTGATKAIGNAIGNISGSLVGETAEELASKALTEGAEEILVTGLSKAAQGAVSGISNTLLSQGVKSGLSEVTGFKTPAEKFVDQPLPPTLQPPIDDTINVIANKAVSGADTLGNVVSGIGSSAAADAITGFDTPAEKFVKEPPSDELSSDTTPPAEDTIVVSGEKIPVVADAATGAVAGIGDNILTPDDLSVYDRVSNMEKEVEEPYEEIVVTGADTTVPIVTPDIGLGNGSVTDTLPKLTPDPALTEKSTFDKIKDATEIASDVLPLLGAAAGGGGDDGRTLPPDTSSLNFTKSTLRPRTIGGVGIGGTGGRYPYTPQTYGRAGGDQETEFLFFTRDPVTGEAVVETGPAGDQGAGQGGPPGKKEGGEIEDDMVKHLVEYHKNGGHQGPGQVKGIGSGQEDKIPAWLSDGEYVWSAQDVADLGDGSTDEGVRRLDKMRQMVRRQAGRKDVKKIAKPQKGIDRMLKAVGGLA